MVEGSNIPPLAWVAFGAAWIAGLTLFSCLFLITRRLGMSWHRRLGGANLETTDAVRLGKLLFGLEAPPQDANVETLVWIVRGCWLAMTLMLVSFIMLMAGIA